MASHPIANEQVPAAYSFKLGAEPIRRRFVPWQRRSECVAGSAAEPIVHAGPENVVPH